MTNFTVYIIPVIIALFIAAGLIKKVPVFDSFIDGAKSGIPTIISILPTLIGLITAVEMFKASGALDMLTAALLPVTDFLGLPAERHLYYAVQARPPFILFQFTAVLSVLKKHDIYSQLLLFPMPLPPFLVRLLSDYSLVKMDVTYIIIFFTKTSFPIKLNISILLLPYTRPINNYGNSTRNTSGTF